MIAPAEVHAQGIATYSDSMGHEWTTLVSDVHEVTHGDRKLVIGFTVPENGNKCVQCGWLASVGPKVVPLLSLF